MIKVVERNHRKNELVPLKGKRGITLIALIVTIIVLLILAGVTIATLTGDNGILTKATEAREETQMAKEKEMLQLIIINKNTNNEEKYDIGEKLYDRTIANGDKWNIIIINDTKEVYGTGWSYIEEGLELEGFGKMTGEWIINYETGEVIKLEKENFTKIKYGENLAVTEELILNVDPVNMSDENSWGEGVTLYGVQAGDNYGWNGSELKLDGVDDYIEVYPTNQVNLEKGLTFEFYANAERNIEALLSKTDSDPKDYSSNRFRTLFMNSSFYCCMSNKNSESDWEDSEGSGYHWIVKKNVGNFTTKEGGYLTVTINIKENSITLYWNGEYVDSTTCNYDWMVSGGLTDNTIPFTIGKMVSHRTSGYQENFAKVNLYACRLYNRILTSEEIKQNYNLTVAYHNLLVQEKN